GIGATDRKRLDRGERVGPPGTGGDGEIEGGGGAIRGEEEAGGDRQPADAGEEVGEALAALVPEIEERIDLELRDLALGRRDQGDDRAHVPGLDPRQLLEPVLEAFE